MAVLPEVETFFGNVEGILGVPEGVLERPPGVVESVGLAQHAVQLLHQFAPPEGDVAHSLPQPLRTLPLSDVGAVVRVPAGGDAPP